MTSACERNRAVKEAVIKFTSESWSRLEAMKKQLRVKTPQEVVKKAILLLEWYLSIRDQGFSIFIGRPAQAGRVLEVQEVQITGF